jgi:hypothetical protein
MHLLLTIVEKRLLSSALWKWGHIVIPSSLPNSLSVPPILVFGMAGRFIAVAVPISLIDIAHVHVIISRFVLQI